MRNSSAGRTDVDEMIRAAMPQQENNRTVATKQKLDSTPDESEPEAKKNK